MKSNKSTGCLYGFFIIMYILGQKKMVKNSIFSEMTGKYLPDSGFETIGASGMFLTKKYRTQDSVYGTFRRAEISRPFKQAPQTFR